MQIKLAVAILTPLILAMPAAWCQSTFSSAEAMHASMAAERSEIVEKRGVLLAAAEIIEEPTADEQTLEAPAFAKVPDARPRYESVAIKHTDPSQLKALTDRTFSTEIASAKGFALVDFGASWCVPCRRMAPAIEALAADDIAAKVATLDVMENRATADRFNVFRIPCLILFVDGKEVDRREGARTAGEIKKWVRNIAARGQLSASSPQPNTGNAHR